ncbi:MAG: ABC transporter permease [Haloarculaceae archaeon]
MGRRGTERRLAAGAGLLTAALLAVMFYYPVGIVFTEALFPPDSPPLAPIGAVLADPFYWNLFSFTAYQALLSTAASLVIGLPGAYLLGRFEFPGRATLESLTALPFVLPSIMVAVGFVATFGQAGTLNDLLRALGLPTVELMFTLQIIVLAHAFYNAPLVVRIVSAAWQRVDARSVETARSLGAGPWRAARDVVLPQLLPAVLTSALLTFVFTFMTFPIVLALGGLQLATVEVWIYDRINSFDLQTAAGLAALETLVSLSLTYLYLRYESRQAGEESAAVPLTRKRLAALGPWRVAVGVYGVVALLVFGLPIASMLLESVTSGGGLTLRWYAFLVERQLTGAAFQTKPLPAIRNSLLFGVGTLLLAVPMGVVVAYATNREFPGARLLGTAAMAPLAVSGIVVGLGLLKGLVYGTVVFGTRIRVVGALAIVAAHAVVAYPFVTRNVAPMLRRLDPRLVEAARALGASRPRALLDVELPLVWPGVAAGAAFAFAISIGEFDATVILAEGASSYTMPVALERYLSGRTLGPATAMGSILLLITAASFVVIDRLGGRFRG